MVADGTLAHAVGDSADAVLSRLSDSHTIIVPPPTPGSKILQYDIKIHKTVHPVPKLKKQCFDMTEMSLQVD